MDHAAQMAAARELRASFSGKSSKAPRHPGGRGGGRNVHGSSAAPRYPQPSVGRHAMSQPRYATGAGTSASVGGSDSSVRTIPPHLRPSVGQNTKQTSGVSQLHQGGGSGAANLSRVTPPHLRGPVGNAPHQPAVFSQNSPPHLKESVGNAPQQSTGFQNAPPHLRTPAGSSTQQPVGSGDSGEGQNPGAKPQAGNHHAAAVPPHLRAPAGISTQQPAGTGGSGEGRSSGVKSQTGNDQPTGNSQAVANTLGGLQNSRFAPGARPSQSAPITQTCTLKDAETSKQTVSADNDDNQPVVSQSTGQHISCSAKDTLPPHLRQTARGPAQQPCDTKTAGGTQGGSAFFNSHTGGTQTNDVFNFQAGNKNAAVKLPIELQNSQLEKDAQPPTSSGLEAIKTTAPRANSADNAGSPAPADHLPDTASSQPVRGRGGLKDSRFASNAQPGGSADPFAALLKAPNTATSSYYSHFGKEDDLSTDVEMLDAGKDPMAGAATKDTYSGVRQSDRRVPRAGPDTKTLQADVLGYRRLEPTWQLAKLVHPTPTPARFNPSREYEPLEDATPRGLGSTAAKQSHVNRPDNVKKSAFGGLASSRFA